MQLQPHPYWPTARDISAAHAPAEEEKNGPQEAGVKSSSEGKSVEQWRDFSSLIRRHDWGVCNSWNCAKPKLTTATASKTCWLNPKNRASC
jgi:hypothetical protein